MVLTKAGKRIGRPPLPPAPRRPEPHEREEFADRLDAILNAMEIGDLPQDVRLFLQKRLRRYDLLRAIDQKRFPVTGEEHITVLIRTVAESSNGPDALTVTVLTAVEACMAPRWTNLGLTWVESFDSIPLLSTLQALRDTDVCDEGELSGLLASAIRRRLTQLLGPPVPPEPKPKPKPRPKTVRPPMISEETWDAVLAMRKSKRKPAQRVAA
jgi:hypothetical protein